MDIQLRPVQQMRLWADGKNIVYLSKTKVKNEVLRAMAPSALGSLEKLIQNELFSKLILEMDTAPFPYSRVNKGLTGYVGFHHDWKHRSL